MAAKFENLLISPGFPIDFRKSHRISKNYLKALRVMNKNLWGVPKDPPGLNRLKPNDKLTFPVFDRIHPFLFLAISNDLDLTALFTYPNFGRK